MLPGFVLEITLQAQRVMSRHHEYKRNFLKGAFSSVSYIRINPQMKIMTEQDRGCNLLSESILKLNDARETYKTIKQDEASMQDESYLVHSRRN
jgi:hypothetical protein